MAAHPPTGADGSPGLETLKELKRAEVEGEARLTALLREGEAALQVLRSDAEAAVHAARVEADRTREGALQDARAKAEAEARTVLADGERAAKLMRTAGAKDVGAVKEQLLDVVLGEFRKGSGKPEA